MNNKRKKGFTLVELVVVLVILGIIAAIAVPFFINYWKKAEFRKNEENAKTVYLAAESRLTYYRSSGQWESFQKEIKQAVKDGESDIAQKAVFKDSEHSNLNDRIYTIKLNKEAKNQTKENNLVLKLLDDYTYDKGFFDASISIEIDLESGEVYSAFYGSRCKGLNYKENDVDGYLTMQKRDYDSRSKRLLGYYSTEDTVNTVNLETKRLRITTINLVNSEKLSLDWSSNVGSDLGVDYEVSFYQNDDSQTKLFSLRVSPYDMGQQGWSGMTDSNTGMMATLELTKADGTKEATGWQFPVTYSDNKYSVVLDAMMSAKVQATLDKNGENGNSTDLEKSSSTSITRLAAVADVLAQPQNIYATVKATAYTGSAKVNVNQEYRDSEPASSNVANTMFGDNTKNNNIEVTAFRHLSNMRYYEKNHNGEATFTLANKNMDWASVGTGLYDFNADKQADGTSVEKLAWRGNTKTETVGFPTIGELPNKYTLTGNGTQTLVSNLHLNEESVADDTTTGKLNISKSEFLGLFAELKGTVKNVTFRDPTLKIGQKDENDSAGDCKALKGIGVLAGRSEGNLTDIAITTTKQNLNQKDQAANIQVDASKNNSDTIGVGALVGVLADYKDGKFETLTSGTISGLSVEGNVEASVPTTTSGTVTSSTGMIAADARGIGGIVGYAKLDNKNHASVKIKDCANHADVSGNLNTGGIVGRLDGNFNYNDESSYSTNTLERRANILNCSSDGLILCTSEDKDSSTVEGNYFGGIAGYSNQALIYKATSASGRAWNFRYSNYVKQKDSILLGDYVGGITGYGSHTLLANCSTEKNGYVLGNQYVGGIAGGLGGGVSEAIQAAGDGGASVTTNASYVIGNSYVGGIVGNNSENVALKNCINNGVAAGYDRYVGGIVGYNQSGSTIADCASYLSDYDSSIYNMIVNDWKATASYAGGIAGYNDGAITFSASSQAITVKSVSSIVVGQNYVGGIAGFNDANATIDVHYTLIGGRIYAYGKCAGGAFGLNASESVLTSELTIKPQSIQGDYYVGGVIGANVVNLGQNVTVSRMRTDNTLGRITGNAFCGGIIGYQRTYASAQLGTAQLKDVALYMLPVLDSNGVPEYSRNALATSRNNNQLTITTTNNIPIRAGLYAGGIVGYCEKESRLLLKDCSNSGDIAQSVASTSDWKDGVILSRYIRSNEVGKAGLPSAADSVKMHFAGGIISVNLENQIVDNCSNTGNMSGYTGSGGVVGLNAGLVYNCSLNQHFGSAALNYIGGIAGINVGQTGTSASKTYNSVSYTVGTIRNCTTVLNKTISGNSNVGGLVGWNLNDGVLTENTSYANISASGNSNIGGIAGRNNGKIIVASDKNADMRSVSARNASGVGGLVGMNEENGTIAVTGNAGTNGEIIAVNSGISVNGSEKVGGIVGINHGVIGEEGSATSVKYLTCKARSVRASHGYAGGIVGETNGDIVCAVNRSATVTADEGTAGGITAVNRAGKTVKNCTNYGNVTSNNGHASGIVAENAGTIDNCIVKSSKSTDTTEIYSRGGDEIGAITSYNTGTVKNSKTDKNVLLNGDATVYGGIVGRNDEKGIVGTAEGTLTMTVIPDIRSIRSNLTVGGAVGANAKAATVTNIQVNAEDTSIFNGFSGYRYLGGVVGDNSGTVAKSGFSGIIKENTGAAGNCYGGIAGINQKNATLQSCNVGKITMDIQGVYTATSTSTAAQKEALATHAGGVVGKNEENAIVDGCTIDNNADSKFTASYGMLGGIVGFNKGTIQMSGSSITAEVMYNQDNTEADTIESLAENAKASGLSADSTYVNISSSTTIENMRYNGGTATGTGSGKTVSAERLQMFMNSNGNVGGITAYNSTTGELAQCVSGNWFIDNKSEAIGVGTGGIIGMNESEKTLSKLINGAFVGRQLKNVGSNRFAGGIIGNQNNATNSDWTIEKCINYGTILCYNSHYSGGIMGQWTGTGGTIEKCRNYGNLQTTYKADWIGASGGIVAQLYHANEKNEYNIISCENHGSIYRSSGRWGEGANDSAGILGNITTFKVSKVSDGQDFTVRIIDCLNGPGVEIASSSMASGIFGFLSCDNVNNNAQNIINSTQNVKFQVERCRNYASYLIGNNFVGGIFGARYNGWKNNTIVNDCYSISLGNSEYNKTGNPIYSNGVSNGNQSPESIENTQDRKNNFFYDGEGAVSGNRRDGYFGSDFMIGKKNEDGSISVGTNISRNVTRASKAKYFSILDNTQIMRNAGDGKYVVTQIYSNITSIRGNECYIDLDGYIKNASGARIGQVLYYVGDEEYPNHDNIYYIASEKTNPSENLLAYNSRESYRRLEGIKKDVNQLLAPAKAEARIENGKIQLSITPQTMDNARNGSEQDKQTYCDPFMYRVKVSNGTEEKIYKIYSENESLDISKELSGKVSISIQAVSMFDDVEASEWYEVSDKNINKVLPDPDVRVELVTDSRATNGHTYRYVLNNLDEYNVVDNYGSAVYPNWQVQINVIGIGSVTLNASNPTATMTAPFKEAGDYSYQMTAQATIASGTSTMAESSRQISTPTELPGYRPPITLKTWKPQLSQNVTISGDTLDELSIKIELGAEEPMNTPPIYRAELIGTWNGQENVVFAKEDILTVSAGKATATFSNLPEYLGQAKDLKVRIWYASSGLGPVYTYYDVDASQITDANVRELVDVDEDGEHWNYSHSTVLENAWVGYERYFDNYQNTTSVLWTWLPAPVLEGADQDGVLMEPTYGADGEINYTFQWDKNISATSSPKYDVSMTGIDASGREVKIDLGDAYKAGERTLTVDGTEWNYSQVKLKVTRIGNAAKKQIGLSTTGTYNVKQRLEQPSQIQAENPDTNELLYNLSWSQISSEEGCAGYQAYIRAYEGDTLGAETALGELVTTDQNQNGTYSEQVDLEKYAGKRVVIYLKAKATMTSAYLDSVAGITNELEIPKRLEKPNVDWTINWTHKLDEYVTAENFENGGLTVGLTAKDNQSVPPGGSAYLLKAYVFNSAADAKAAVESDSSTPKNYIQAYPVDGTVVQMDAKTTHDYSHSLQNLSIKYAGKWIVFYARISSGAGNISSEWTKSESYRLPYVKLKSPQVISAEAADTLTASVTETPEVPGTDQQWTATRTTLNWNSIDCADMFTLNLTGTITDPNAKDNKSALNADVRIKQTESGIVVQVYRLVEVTKTDQDGKPYKEKEWQWVDIAENDTASQYPDGTPETEIHHVFDITDYSVTIESTYQAANGGTPTYKLTLGTQLDVVKNEDGTYSYVLKLPDVSDVKAADGSSVTHSNFNITDQAVFKANVTENVKDDQIIQRSEAYIESDETKIEWKK